MSEPIVVTQVAGEENTQKPSIIEEPQPQPESNAEKQVPMEDQPTKEEVTLSEEHVPQENMEPAVTAKIETPPQPTISATPQPDVILPTSIATVPPVVPPATEPAAGEARAYSAGYMDGYMTAMADAARQFGVQPQAMQMRMMSPSGQPGSENVAASGTASGLQPSQGIVTSLPGNVQAVGETGGAVVRYPKAGKAEKDPYLDQRVTIWNRVEQRKLSGNSAPFRRNLQEYLNQHKVSHTIPFASHISVTHPC